MNARTPRRPLSLLAAVASLLGLAALGTSASNFQPAPVPETAADTFDATTPSGLPESELLGADGRLHAFVELAGPPAAVVYANTLAELGSSPSAVAAANAAARQQRDANRAAQDDLGNRLAGSPIAAQEVYRVQRVLNGITVRVEPGKLASIARLPGVAAVRLIVPEVPFNSTSVPFLAAPPAWGDTLGLGVNLTGTGVTIGIIDTGVDYQHSNFGGTGVLADYQANDRTVAPDAFFPSAKVGGGNDFAGDTYNAGGNGGTTGSPVPVPDPDPMDCNSHGTHVSGTAAGFGVNADGTTFAGPYGPAVPFGSLRIGPGVAPQATLYGLRVFGCQGSTALTAQAIDWATDPNDDSDFSDHLDVINLSLGSNYGSGNDTTALAAENASLVGVIVAAASGNASDSFFLTSSPAVSGRAINVAAIQDSGLAGAILTINAPGAIAGSYAAANNAFTGDTVPPTPPPSGQTATVVLGVDPTAPAACGASPNDGCCAFTNAAAIAGNIVLVDRGTCNFTLKVQNAQAAGAIGVLVGNNVTGDPVPNVMGGAAGFDVNVPAISVSQATRNAITSQPVGSVNATLVGANAGDTIAGFSSRGPRRIASPIKLKPDIAAPGQTITSSFSGVTFAGGSCSPQCNVSFVNAGNNPLNNNGTSMATPHIAGLMALLRQEHPTWTVEELKALAMNYATHDPTLGAGGTPPRFGPGRTGAGRADASNAATGQVIAMSADDPGLVSVSFGTEIVGAQVRTRTVRVVNHGPTPQTYDLGIDTVVDSPGVSFSLPGGSSLTVPAGGTTTFTVQMDANANSMDNAFEATLATGQAVTAPAGLAGLGAVARHRLNEEAGFVTFSQSSTLRFRVPLYSTPRPATQMSAGSVPTGGAGTGSGAVALAGTDFCTGALGPGPACSGTFPVDEVGLVSPFELQIQSPQNPALPLTARAADLQYAGVAADPTGATIFFGVSSYHDWSSAAETTFNIWIDNNEDGTWDRVVFNSSLGAVSRHLFGSAADNPQDNYLSFVFTPPGTVGSQFFINTSPTTIDSVVMTNNVMVIPVQATAIGLTAGNNNFRYRIETCPYFAPLCSALPAFVVGSGFDNSGAGFVTWDRTARGLDFGGFLFEDLNGDTVPVTWNTANLATNGSLGGLFLHHHNTEGSRAEVVPLDTALTADLSLTKSMAPPAPNVGDNVVFTLTVTNNGPDTASGISVFDALPPGLTYVSDNGAGAYVPATGVWTVPGSLAASASASLQITATVETTAEIENVAQISTASPLDPDPSDNRSRVVVNAPESADLELAMSASVPTVLVGASFDIDLTATNNGDDTAFSISVNELFTGFEPLTPTASTPSSGVYNPATGLWSIPSLGDVTGPATLSLTFTAPNMAGPLTNNGTAASTTADPDNANNAASATVTVLSPATISSTKTVGGTFTVGSTVTYTVTLNNSSTFDQQDNPGDELTDVLPSQLTLVSAVASSGTAVANVGLNTVTWNGSVPGSGSVTITITATIEAGTELQTVVNQGTTSSDADGNGVNEASGATDDPGQPGAADPTSFVVGSPSLVASTKTVSGTFEEGGTVTYTVVLNNTGASQQLDNPGNEFTDVLPAQLTLVSAAATAGSAVATIATNTVTWNGAIPAAGSVTITITATVDAGTALQTVSNQGTVISDSDGNGSNETTSSTDDPGQPGAADPTSFVVGSPAAVGGSKTVSGNFVEGGSITYTIVLTNTGQAQLDNPGDELVDVLPPELALVSATATSGTALADLGTNTVTWNGSIPASGSVTITIEAVIGSGLGSALIANQGTINFDGDGNGTNESTGETDDPAVGGAADPTVFGLGAALDIPTQSAWGLALLMAALAGAALFVLRRRM